MQNKDILKKLYKIASNQQTIINKMVKVADNRKAVMNYLSKIVNQEIARWQATDLWNIYVPQASKSAFSEISFELSVTVDINPGNQPPYKIYIDVGNFEAKNIDPAITTPVLDMETSEELKNRILRDKTLYVLLDQVLSASVQSINSLQSPDRLFITKQITMLSSR